MREILDAQGWKYPEGWQPDNIARCRGCDAEILWCLTAAGRKSPVNRDGTSHFSDCPAADQFRRKPVKVRRQP